MCWLHHVMVTCWTLSPNFIIHGQDSTTAIPLSPNYHHFATSCMAKTLPRQYHFHQTTTILQRHAWPRLYHVNTTFTKLPPFCNVMHGQDSTTSIPLSQNYHHFATSCMTKTLPRQYHFHQTTTISQRHAWPRLYHVNTIFTKLPPFCNVMHGQDSTTSIPLSPKTTILQRHAWPRLYHVNSTFNKTNNFATSCMAKTLPRQFHFQQKPQFCNVMHGQDSTTSIPLSTKTTILQRHAWPRLYHVNSTFAKLSISCNTMVTALRRQWHFHLSSTSWPRDYTLCRFHVTATFLQRGNHVVC